MNIFIVGVITPEVVVAIFGLYIIAAAVINKSRVSNILALVFGTIVWWSKESWPTKWAEAPSFQIGFYLSYK